MITLMLIIVIGIIVLARVFSRSRGKDTFITIPFASSNQPCNYPENDPLMTDPTFRFFGGNFFHDDHRQQGEI